MERGRRNTEVVAELLRSLLEVVHASQNALVEAAAQVADPGGARLLSSLATSRVRLERELRELLARVETVSSRLGKPSRDLQELISSLSQTLHFGRISQVLRAAATVEAYVAQRYDETANQIVGNVGDVLRRHAAAIRSNGERLQWRGGEPSERGGQSQVTDSPVGRDRIVNRDS
jgi:hypothetical protein